MLQEIKPVAVLFEHPSYIVILRFYNTTSRIISSRSFSFMFAALAVESLDVVLFLFLDGILIVF